MTRPCITCLRCIELTRSHVIPESVGGRLSDKLECQECNSRIGLQYESRLKLDPSVRLAIEWLAEALPALAANMRRSAPFMAYDEEVSVKARWTGSDFAVCDTPQPDESIIKGDKAAEQDLRRRLGRANARVAEVDAAIDRWMQAPDGVRVDLGRGISVRKGAVARFNPDFRGSHVAPHECALAIAYRFLACLLGPAIYDDAFDRVRRALQGEPGTTGWDVADGHLDRPYAPLHGLGVLQVDPHILVRVCLFDRIVWDVGIAVAMTHLPSPHKYVLSLEDGTEEVL